MRRTRRILALLMQRYWTGRGRAALSDAQACFRRANAWQRWGKT